MTTESAPGANAEHFHKALVETIRWRTERGRIFEPVNGLRPPVLRPSLLNGDVEYPRGWGTPNERHDAIEALAAVRRELLRTERCEIGDPLIEIPKASPLHPFSGRLLAFDPDQSLSDGAACVATAGFFENDNVPPWDTWIYYFAGPDNEGKHPFNSYLLSWVPPEFMESVAYGLDVNPEGCILWATDLDRPFIHRLKDAGLLF